MTKNGQGDGLCADLFHKQIPTLFAFAAISVVSAGVVNMVAKNLVQFDSSGIVVNHISSVASQVLGESSIVDTGYIDSSSPNISGWSYNAARGVGATVTITVENVADPKVTFVTEVQPTITRADAANWLRSTYGASLPLKQPLGFSVDPKTFVTTPGSYRIRNIITEQGVRLESSKLAQNIFGVTTEAAKVAPAPVRNSTNSVNAPNQSMSPDGVTLPNTTTQTTLTWPSVQGATSYQVFANDMSDPGSVTCSSGNFYFCSGFITGTTTTIQLTPGHTYQWWVKALNNRGVVIGEKDTFFSVAPLDNQLYVRVSRSYMSAGESYYLYAVTRPVGKNVAGYTGLLDALAYSCPARTPTQCNQPVVAPWGSYALVDGSVKVDIPANFPPGIYKAKFRPRGSNAPWSNEIVVNVGTTAGLEDMTQYWIMPTDLAPFSGTNTATAENFNTAIGYSPVTACATQMGSQARTMYFTKDKADGYWTPKYPWTDLWATDGTQNLRWHLIPWQQKPGWHDEYLTAWGDQRYTYNPASLSAQGNFQNLVSSVRYESTDPKFPGYILSPHWVASGYGISNPNQKYNIVDGQDGDLCSLDFDPASQGNWAALWVVHIDKTVLHTSSYDGPAMRIKFYEGDINAWFLREDWYFVKNVGLVRIEQKNFGVSKLSLAPNPITPCAQDLDCLSNEFMLKPHTTMSRGSGAVVQPPPPVIKDGYVDTATSTNISGWSYDSTAGSTGQSVTVVVENIANTQSTFSKVVPPTVNRADAFAYLRRQYGTGPIINQALGFSVDPTTFVTIPGTYRIRSVTTVGGYTLGLSVNAQNTFTIGGNSAFRVKVNNADTAVTHPGGGYTLTAEQGSTIYVGLLEYQLVICQDQCGPMSTGLWGGYTTTDKEYRVILPINFPLGTYKARFRPAYQNTVQWSNEISVTLTNQ